MLRRRTEIFLILLTSTFIARANLSVLSERLFCFLENFVPYEFTVLPSLKCLGRASFRLPLTKS